MLCNGRLLIYLSYMVYGPNAVIFSFELYRSPLDPVKCIVEEEGPKSGSDDKRISH